jgi:hypothetical protein
MGIALDFDAHPALQRRSHGNGIFFITPRINNCVMSIGCLDRIRTCLCCGPMLPANKHGHCLCEARGFLCPLLWIFPDIRSIGHHAITLFLRIGRPAWLRSMPTSLRREGSNPHEPHPVAPRSPFKQAIILAILTLASPPAVPCWASRGAPSPAAHPSGGSTPVGRDHPGPTRDRPAGGGHRVRGKPVTHPRPRAGRMPRMDGRGPSATPEQPRNPGGDLPIA